MNKTKAQLIAESMPSGLKHSVEGQPFDIRNSEVIKWLTSQPEILHSLFDYFRKSGAIFFDKETKTWSGKNPLNHLKTQITPLAKIQWSPLVGGVAKNHSTPLAPNGAASGVDGCDLFATPLHGTAGVKRLSIRQMKALQYSQTKHENQPIPQSGKTELVENAKNHD